MIQHSTVISRGDPETPTLFGKTNLFIKAFRGSTDNVFARREVINRVITDAGRDYIIACFYSTAYSPNLFNYHDFGEGVTAESTADTAMETPISEARATGTQDSTGNAYTSVAIISFSSSYAITEHGVFTQATKPGGTLLDRSVFAAVNVTSDDSIQATYTLTMDSGG